jgi:hypothetical protein
MSEGSTRGTSQETESVRGIDRALELCLDALEICDAMNLSAEVAAKLQEAIAAIEGIRKG